MSEQLTPFRPYFKRPVRVEAFRWDGSAVPGFERIAVQSGELVDGHSTLKVRTLRGITYACPGDWIVRLDDGTHEVSRDSAFRSFYQVDGAGS